MDVKELYIDNQDVLRDGSSGIYYTQVDRRRFRTTQENRTKQGNHGRTTSPVYAGYRIITLEGVIDGLGNDYLEQAIRYLEKVFSLQGDTSTLVTKTLRIKDLLDYEREAEVIVVDPLVVLEHDETFTGAYYRRRVVLETAETPVLKSYQELQKTLGSSYGAGFTFPFSFDFDFSTYENITQVTVTGNVHSPINFQLTANVDYTGPLYIINTSNGKRLKFNVSGSAGDVLVFDSENNTATKNGVDILSLREAGSSWLYVEETADFVILTASSLLDDFTVKTTFRNNYL